MAKKKITKLAQALLIVDEMPTEDVITLSDYLRTRFTFPKSEKSSAQSAGKKSKPMKSTTDTPPASTADGTENASSVGVCAECGAGKTYGIHQLISVPGYHPFLPPKRAKSKVPVVYPETEGYVAAVSVKASGEGAEAFHVLG